MFNQTQASPEETKSHETIATVLATGVTVTAAALGVFSGLTGAVARMTRNHEVQTPICLTLVIAAVVLAIASRFAVPTITKKGGITLNLIFLALSLLSFAAGLVWSVWLMSASIGDDDRPSVSAKLSKTDNDSIISGVAKAGGLAAQEPIYVWILARTGDGSSTPYSAVIGANQDGLVEHEFSLVLKPDVRKVTVLVSRDHDVTECPDFDTDRAETTSCATLKVPRG